MDIEKEYIYKDIFYTQRMLILKQRRDMCVQLLIFAGIVTVYCSVCCIGLLSTGSIVLGVIEAVLVIVNLFNCIWTAKRIVTVNREIKRADALYQIELAVREDIGLQ